MMGSYRSIAGDEIVVMANNYGDNGGDDDGDTFQLPSNSRVDWRTGPRVAD